jgi:hypothetical protein
MPSCNLTRPHRPENRSSQELRHDLTFELSHRSSSQPMNSNAMCNDLQTDHRAVMLHMTVIHRAQLHRD